MKTLNPVAVKRSKKQERQYRVLMGLVQLFIESGKPIGSNTLKDNGFSDLSSATIRNYFVRLEKEGYLSQQHSSGGRQPTAKAFREYANENAGEFELDQELHQGLQVLRQTETREIAAYLQQAGETLSSLLKLPVFLSSPRFDHDFVLDIKLVRIDTSRCLVVIITDFGVIQTEILPIDNKISTFALHRMEAYFHWRLTGYDKPENIKPEEERLAQELYNEIMVRYVVSYSNCSHEHLYQTGFSRLLSYPEFNEADTLARGLALFENHNSLRLLLREAHTSSGVKFWICDDLKAHLGDDSPCAVIASPYCLNHKGVGAIGVLGPIRLPYRQIFAALQLASEYISETLTRSIYKFKITYRQPMAGHLYLDPTQEAMLGESEPMLLEDKRNV